MREFNRAARVSYPYRHLWNGQLTILKNVVQAQGPGLTGLKSAAEDDEPHLFAILIPCSNALYSLPEAGLCLANCGSRLALYAAADAKQLCFESSKMHLAAALEQCQSWR